MVAAAEYVELGCKVYHTAQILANIVTEPRHFADQSFALGNGGRCFVERVDVAFVREANLELLTIQVCAEGSHVQGLEMVDVHEIFVDEFPVAIKFGHVFAGEAAIFHLEHAEGVVEPGNR